MHRGADTYTGQTCTAGQTYKDTKEGRSPTLSICKTAILWICFYLHSRDQKWGIIAIQIQICGIWRQRGFNLAAKLF